MLQFAIAENGRRSETSNADETVRSRRLNDGLRQVRRIKSETTVRDSHEGRELQMGHC
jgi:hypothetical protein